MAFSPNGDWLASGSAEKTVKIWDVETGQTVKSIQGHLSWVNSVAFSDVTHCYALDANEEYVFFAQGLDAACFRREPYLWLSSEYQANILCVASSGTHFVIGYVSGRVLIIDFRPH